MCLREMSLLTLYLKLKYIKVPVLLCYSYCYLIYNYISCGILYFSFLHYIFKGASYYEGQCYHITS